MHLPLWDMTNVVVWRVSSLQEFLGQVRYNLINFTTARAVLVLFKMLTFYALRVISIKFLLVISTLGKTKWL